MYHLMLEAEVMGMDPHKDPVSKAKICNRKAGNLENSLFISLLTLESLLVIKNHSSSREGQWQAKLYESSEISLIGTVCLAQNTHSMHVCSWRT